MTITNLNSHSNQRIGVERKIPAPPLSLTLPKLNDASASRLPKTNNIATQSEEGSGQISTLSESSRQTSSLSKVVKVAVATLSLSLLYTLTQTRDPLSLQTANLEQQRFVNASLSGFSRCLFRTDLTTQGECPYVIASCSRGLVGNQCSNQTASKIKEVAAQADCRAIFGIADGIGTDEKSQKHAIQSVLERVYSIAKDCFRESPIGFNSAALFEFIK